MGPPGVLAAGLFGGVAQAAPFPPEVQVGDLLPDNGGDGTYGFVIAGDFLSGVSSGADVNGDGIDDLALGRQAGHREHGAVYVVFGRDAGIPVLMELADLRPENGGDGTLGFVIESAAIQDGTGGSISFGDINGDGLSDIAIGAPFGDRYLYDGARIYVVFGRSAGFPALIDLGSLAEGEGFVASSPVARQQFGRSVDLSGDINGDGFDDLVAGSSYSFYYYYGNSPAGFGIAVVEGRDTGFPSQLVLDDGPVLEGSAGPVSVGDVNGDGIDDIVAGSRYSAYGYPPEIAQNEAFALVGPYGGLPARSNLPSLADGDGSEGTVFASALDYMGFSVAAAGDINGDGIGDLLLGDGNYSHGYPTYSSGAYLVFGHAPHLEPVVDAGDFASDQGGDGTDGVFLSDTTGSKAGYSLSGAGDVNGDGVDDFLVGNKCVPHGCDYYYAVVHRTYLVFGARDGFPGTFELNDLSPEGGGDGTAGIVLSAPEGFFGAGTAGGDVNDDGLDDVVMIGPDPDTGLSNAYVVFGRDGGTHVPNVAPYFTSEAVTDARPGDEYRYRVTAVDPDHGDTLALSADALPGWLAFADHGDGSALLSGMPTEADLGDVAITLHVADNAGPPHTDTQTFTLTVALNEAPAFTSAPVEDAREGFEYRYDIRAADADGDTLTIAATELPAWLTLTDEGNGSATLIGTPGSAEAGGHDVVIEVHDDAGQSLSGTQSFTIVVAANEAPQFVTTPPLEAREGVKYVYTITVQDPEGDGVQLRASSIPGWMTLEDFGDGTGELRGTPNAAKAGDVTIVIEAVDDAPIERSVEQTFVLSVLANEAPVFASTPLREAVVGQAYRYEVTVDDADPDDEVAITASVLPPWLQLTDHGDRTATLSGTPTQADLGDHPVTLEAGHDTPVEKVTNQGFIIEVASGSDDDDGGGGALGPLGILGLAVALRRRLRRIATNSTDIAR